MKYFYLYRHNGCRRSVYSMKSASQYKHHRRLKWEVFCKQEGFPLKFKETSEAPKSVSQNASCYDYDWNERGSLNRSWKSQRKVRKQWMR